MMLSVLNRSTHRCLMPYNKAIGVLATLACVSTILGITLLGLSLRGPLYTKDLFSRSVTGFNLSSRPLRDPNSLSSDSVEEKKQKRPPKCLIIGFTKCGTSALRGFLTLHPDIVTAMREIRYFTSNYDKGVKWYLNQVPESRSSQITIEKSAGYITSIGSLQRIQAFNSSIKLIVMVRNPITRLLSEYSRIFETEKTSSKSRRSFKSWCGGDSANSSILLKHVDYATPLEDVYQLFPKRQVLVIEGESFEKNPVDVLRSVEKFLHLRPSFSENELYLNKEKGFHCFNMTSPNYTKTVGNIMVNEKTGCLGKRRGRPHPEIEAEFLRKLVHVIRPFNERLFKLIGKRFKWEHFEDE